MKKTILVVLMTVGLFAGVAKAEDPGAYFKWQGVEFTYPLAHTSAIALYDIWQGEGLMGAETRLVAYGVANLNFGAVTSFLGHGTPFLSLDFNLAKIMTNAPEFLARAGLWIGRDFTSDEYRAGVKCSVPLW